MRAFWLWLLRRLHNLSMSIALWAKAQADSFDLPAPLAVPETRQAGEPPADWLARVQNASQPPAHWLEYIQSKTGQMPQMQDMSAIVPEQPNPAKAPLPVVQEQVAQRPKVANERPLNWRKNQPPKVVTVIDELPVPQSKDAAISSYQSPSSNRIPERLHWRIQKPSGKSVFELPELQKQGETETTYPDLQETKTQSVAYTQTEQVQAKKPRYRLLKRGMRGKVAYQALENQAASEANFSALNSPSQTGRANYPAPQTLTPDHSAAQSDSTPPSPSWRGETSSKTNVPDYQAPQTSPKPLADYPKTQVSGNAQANYQAPQTLTLDHSAAQSDSTPPSPSWRGETNMKRNSPEYPAPPVSGNAQADYQAPQVVVDSNTNYQAPQAKPQTETSFSTPEQSQSATATYSQANPNAMPAAKYAAPNETYRDNPVDFAGEEKLPRRDGQAEGSPYKSAVSREKLEPASYMQKQGETRLSTNEAQYSSMNAPTLPNADYAAPTLTPDYSAARSDSTPPSPSWRGEKKDSQQYSQSTKPNAPEAHYAKRPETSPAASHYSTPKQTSPESSQASNSAGATTANAANYAQAEQSPAKASRFERGQMLSDAKTVLANASNEYWIALPHETGSSGESPENPHTSRLDAEQRGEF